jgi:hypothetical protein
LRYKTSLKTSKPPIYQNIVSFQPGTAGELSDITLISPFCPIVDVHLNATPPSAFSHVPWYPAGKDGQQIHHFLIRFPGSIASFFLYLIYNPPGCLLPANYDDRL